MTKQISKSFIDEKEIKKEYLRKKIESKENNLNQVKLDLTYERARMKNANLEKAQDSIKPMIEGDERVKEKNVFLKKFLNNGKSNREDAWKKELITKYEKCISNQESKLKSEYNYREMNRSFEIGLRDYDNRPVSKDKSPRENEANSKVFSKLPIKLKKPTKEKNETVKSKSKEKIKEVSQEKPNEQPKTKRDPVTKPSNDQSGNLGKKTVGKSSSSKNSVDSKKIVKGEK